MPEQVQEQGGAVSPPAVREVDLLCQEIQEARQRQLKTQIDSRKPAKREIMYLSDVHDCARRNYYSMAEGDQRPQFNEFVQAKLNAGVEWEQIMKRELSQLGFEPMLAGEVIEIKNKAGDVIARGRTDLSVARKSNHRKLFPAEMKQMQSHMWAHVNTWKDLLRNPWTRKYLRQIMLYMYGKNAEEGLFILGDFQGHWKLIPVYLDYAFCEDAIAKIETAAKSLLTGQAPDRIVYDHELCGRCDFAQICIPNINLVPSEKIEGNDALAVLLEKRDGMIDKWREVERLNTKIKAFFESVKTGVFSVGNFIITRKAQQRTSYEIPDDIKLKYASKKDIYKNEIERFAAPDPDKIFLEPGRFFDLSDE